MRHRVVVTGLGVISPVGNDVAAFWDALKTGRSGITRIQRFDAEAMGLPVTIAGESQDCAPADMGPKELRRRDRYTLFALCASDQAWAQSGLDINSEDPERCGVVLGSGIGGLETIEEQHRVFMEKGAARISPLMIPKLLSNMAAGEVAIRLGLQGPNKAVVTACASGAQSIAEAVNNIRCGHADVMLAGGSEAGVVPLALQALRLLRHCRGEMPSLNGPADPSMRIGMGLFVAKAPAS